jgi:phage portal protein BeeE
MNFIDNILRKLGYTNERQFFTHRNHLLGQQGAVWVDTDVPYKLYNELAEIKAPVDKLGNMFSNMELKYRNKTTGETTELPADLNALFMNPNPLQSFNDFLFNYFTQKKVYGNQYILKDQVSRLAKYPQRLINVSPAICTPILTGKLYKQVDMSGIVKYYELKDNNTIEKIETPNILWSRIADLDNPLVGKSPLVSLRFPITNTKLAYEYFNVISGQRGAIGMLSSESKDAMGVTPMTAEMKKDVIDQYTRTYGVQDGQSKIIMPDIPTKWTPFSYPTKDLLLQEQIDKNFLTILNSLQVNPNLYVNSTYENLKHGLIMTYNDAVFPEADAFTQAMTKFLNVEKGFELVADYSHISILQSDKKSENETIQTKTNYLTQLVTAGIITPQQAQNVIANDINLEVQNG